MQTLLYDPQIKLKRRFLAETYLNLLRFLLFLSCENVTLRIIFLGMSVGCFFLLLLFRVSSDKLSAKILLIGDLELFAYLLQLFDIISENVCST